MGMMNNCWYIVKPEISEKDDGVTKILFRHPTEPGTKNGGWMQLSESEKINEAKQAAGAPQKQFTREEIGEWKGVKRHVGKAIIKENLFVPDGGKESVVFLCGPPAMIQKAALPALRD